MSSKSQRAVRLGTFMAVSRIAERSTSAGKPVGELKSAQSTVPIELRIFRIVTWIPGQAAAAARVAAGTRSSAQPTNTAVAAAAARSALNTAVR